MSDQPKDPHRSLRIMLCALGFALLLTPLVEVARPGTLMCPLRRAVKKIRVEMGEDPDRIVDGVWSFRATAGEINESGPTAERWRAEALALYPNLHLNPQPVPVEENGYEQCRLAAELKIEPNDSFGPANWEKLQGPDEARAALASNQKWIEEVERIAALTKSSRQNAASEWRGREDPEVCKADLWCIKGHEALLVEALLTTDSKNEEQIFHRVELAEKFGRHLIHLDVPTSVTLSIGLGNRARLMKFISARALPAIGPSADLQRWREMVVALQTPRSQISLTVSGMWNLSCMAYYQQLVIAHRRHLIADAHDTALAMAKNTSLEISSASGESLPHLIQMWTSISPPADVSVEGREFLEQWDFSRHCLLLYARDARRHALHLAALDLLILEKSQGKLSAEDAQRVTIDPITELPFTYDPADRTLHATPGPRGYKLDESLKLPW